MVISQRLVVCFNVREKRFFETAAVHLVEHLYRNNYYRLALRLSFYTGDVDLTHRDDLRQLCFRKITNLMTSENMWQNQNSFYVIDYDVRLIDRNNINGDDDDAHSISSLEMTDNSDLESVDSAYGSPSPDSTIALDLGNESLSSSYSSDEAFNDL